MEPMLAGNGGWRAHGDATAESLAAQLWPAGGELDQRLRPHLRTGSRLLITTLPAIGDMHRQLAGVA